MVISATNSAWASWGAQGAARWNRIRPWLHAWIAGDHQTRSLVHGNKPLGACVDAPHGGAGNGPTDDPAPIRAAKTLGILGAMMSLGYPGEESVRQAWRHPNRSITALTVVAELLAVSMAWLGLRRQLR